MLKICLKQVIYRAVLNFFLTGYRSLATIKILVILIVTVLKTILKIAFSNLMFSTKISYVTQQV